MLPPPLNQIDVTYLLGLPEAGGPAESRTVDYKKDFTRNSKGGVEGAEVRADVSAFADSEGGDLIIGIHAVAGIPVEVQGIEVENRDAPQVGRATSFE